MKPTCTNRQPLNEYTEPLAGEPYYRSSGIIYAVGDHNYKYAVSYIDYERYDDQHFQYVFTPLWYLIDALSPSIFQGIPGLDLTLRLEKYYRVNVTPTFISERTPSSTRADLPQLLAAVNLNYYDRFEWLLRTDMCCGTDNLIVERITKTDATPRFLNYYTLLQQHFSPEPQPGDCIAIDSLANFSTSSHDLRTRLLTILRSGATIYLKEEDRLLSPEECGVMLKLLLLLDAADAKYRKLTQATGIQKAKDAGKYSGRKRMEIDPILMAEILLKFEQQQITEREARERLGGLSRSTFYRRLKEARHE